MHRVIALLTLLVIGLGAARAQGEFKPLFNGKDLSGWHNVNCAPSTWFVKDKMIITTGKPTGYLRSEKQYENFILEFEWFHAPATKGAVGNSGLFVWGDPIPAVGTGYTRSIEVQVLVNLEAKDKKTGGIMYTSHGDLFSIWGAKCKPDRPHPLGWERCLPSERNAKGEYEWNHYRVVANDGVLKLAVNGKEVSGVSECNPRKGYLALESEGSECRFKNIILKELPSTNPKPEEICDVDKGWKCLFTGLDLTGWKPSEQSAPNWKMGDGVLRHDGKDSAGRLISDASFGDYELVVDWAGAGKAEVAVRNAGKESATIPLMSGKKGGTWNRTIIRVKGTRMDVKTNGALVADNRKVSDGPSSIALHATGSVQFRNVFVRDLKND